MHAAAPLALRLQAAQSTEAAPMLCPFQPLLTVSVSVALAAELPCGREPHGVQRTGRDSWAVTARWLSQHAWLGRLSHQEAGVAADVLVTWLAECGSDMQKARRPPRRPCRVPLPAHAAARQRGDARLAATNAACCPSPAAAQSPARPQRAGCRVCSRHRAAGATQARSGSGCRMWCRSLRTPRIPLRR